MQACAALFLSRQPQRAVHLRIVVLKQIEKLTFRATKEKTTLRQAPPQQHRKKGKLDHPLSFISWKSHIQNAASAALQWSQRV
jgi:hypothetical protein